MNCNHCGCNIERNHLSPNECFDALKKELAAAWAATGVARDALKTKIIKYGIDLLEKEKP